MSDDSFVEAVEARAAIDGPGPALAEATRTLARWSGVDLPDGLTLFEREAQSGAAPRLELIPPDRVAGAGATGVASSPAGDAASVLGACFEALLSGDERVAGAHHTAPMVADHVVGLALGPGSFPTSICDPAVGGGVFLLAVAERLATSGLDRRSVLDRLWGFDRDPLAVAVTEAALALWAASPSTGPGPRLAAADFLLDGVVHELCPSGGWELIVGNPPFQSQLVARTARGRGRAEDLRTRFGASSSGYVDEAGLFALAAVGHLADGGRLALVLPASLLAAADAGGVRASIAEQAPVQSIWVPETQLFTAGVDVVVPVFARRAEATAVEVTRAGPGAGTPSRRGRPEGNGGSVPPVGAEWAGLLADAEGVPRAPLDASVGTVGDRANVTAGFRQHFYAIAAVVTDDAGADRRPVATVGLIDPLTNLWGARSTRIGRSSLLTPSVDTAAMEASPVRTWIDERHRPKVLVATQTRVVEAVADVDGSVVPSTPLISVEPTDPDADLWPLLAVLCAPPVTAWLHRRAAGSGLSAGRIRLSAAQIRTVPLPSDPTAWAAAATIIETASADSDLHARRLGLLEAGRRMTTAYDCPEAVCDWWTALLPPIAGPVGTR